MCAEGQPPTLGLRGDQFPTGLENGLGGFLRSRIQLDADHATMIEKGPEV